MSKVWYGSIDNRLQENKQFCDTIEVGTGVTEYFYSDRHAYEVVNVIDQKHVEVREYDAKHIGGAYENKWELKSNPAKPIRLLTKRGNYWYWTVTVTVDDLNEIESKDKSEKIDGLIWLSHLGINADELRNKGKITRRNRANVSFGVADYYYDYEF